MPEKIQEQRADRTILTVREVAQYLRMSQTKVCRLVKERRLPVARVGKVWRFRKDLLDDWLSKCTESSMDEVGTPRTTIKKASIGSHPRD